MTDGVVEFDVAEFREEYPFFSKLTDTQLNSLFRKACLRLRNDAKSCVKDIYVRNEFLYLIVAHLATLFQKALDGNSLVGRISSASEGSVSVSSEYSVSQGGGEKWWSQTPWGADYWTSSAPYRVPNYVTTNFAMPVDRRGYPRNRFYNS